METLEGPGSAKKTATRGAREESLFLVLQFETQSRLEELLRVTHRPSRLSSLILAPLPPPKSAAAIREASRADAETSRVGGWHLPWEPLLVKRVMERALDEVLREAQVMHAVDDLLTAPLPHFQQLFPEENLKDYSWIAQPTSDSGSCTGEEGSGRADARPSSTSESLKAEAPAAQLRPNNGEAAALVGTLEKSPPALRSPLLGHFVFHDAPLDPLPPVRPACRTAQLLLSLPEKEREKAVFRSVCLLPPASRGDQAACACRLVFVCAAQAWEVAAFAEGAGQKTHRPSSADGTWLLHSPAASTPHGENTAEEAEGVRRRVDAKLCGSSSRSGGRLCLEALPVFAAEVLRLLVFDLLVDEAKDGKGSEPTTALSVE